MTECNSDNHSIVSRQLSELKLLYQFSNTMLSTISMNKLTHLILTALITGKSALFERSMIFLCNERSGSLQGMLGVVSGKDNLLENVGDENLLSSRWDIRDEIMAEQRVTPFCSSVRASRIDIDHDCPVVKDVVIAQKTIIVTEKDCLHCQTCNFLNALGVISFAAAPLMARGKTLGIIVVDNPVSGLKISGSSLQFLHLFANQAGMAMENSILYTRIDDAHSSLKVARERLIHGERLAAIGEMAANLAHELKNPLITIGGFAGRLLKSLPSDGKEFHCADTIVKETARLERMLAEVLAFSRKPTICFTSCELGAILAETLESCVTTLEDRGIQVSVDIENKKWNLVGDCYQLKQVFVNLILNACDVMLNGGSISIFATLSEEKKNSVQVKIFDTGGGIPKEMIYQVFNPFFTTKHHGTGLGLAIVNRIIQNHHGSISVHNEGAGAVFCVMLPLASDLP